jgi:hypothetical protein
MLMHCSALHNGEGPCPEGYQITDVSSPMGYSSPLDWPGIRVSIITDLLTSFSALTVLLRHKPLMS